LERHIYVPAPDAESRKKIFEVYLQDTGAVLSKDISINELVEKTDGYVGADIEALVREAKLGAMREFIATMAGKTEQEVTDAAMNVMITKKHFEDAIARIRGSLDRDALEAAERQAWHMIYNQEQREVLEYAVGVIKRAELRSKGTANTKDLRSAMYKRMKDFGEIKKLTERLEKLLEPKAAH
jgi:transitional endoplasmic reticulum ATPase